jgi:SAM-dependent methyltransferase
MLNERAGGRFEDEFRRYREKRIAAWSVAAQPGHRSWGGYYRRRLQDVFKLMIPVGMSVLEVGCGRGDLLAAVEPAVGVGIDLTPEMVAQARARHPHLEFHVADAHDFVLPGRTFDFIILSDVVNDLWDLQAALERLQPCCSPSTRLVFNFFSHLWQVPLSLAQFIGIAMCTEPQNWLSRQDLHNLLELSGFEALRSWEEVVMPLPVPGISYIANRFLAKVAPFRWFAMTNFMVARPSASKAVPAPTVSVIVAARNEEGHIDELLARIPNMGSATEIVFVEGNSTDDTWGAIERAIAACPMRRCKLLKQRGRGKGDAVRAGFDAASGDILMILDADITVPPEDLPRFYDVLVSGHGEFANGVRLVYPMDEEAMRFANLVGNKFFSFAFSWLLGQPIRDTLCGTKVLWARDYRRIAANRAYFGDFDPFGDFDLLFGAAKLNLKILEVPIRYRARRYGETNIRRWSHGWLLLRMVVFAARRMKFV